MLISGLHSAAEVKTRSNLRPYTPLDYEPDNPIAVTHLNGRAIQEAVKKVPQVCEHRPRLTGACPNAGFFDECFRGALWFVIPQVSNA